MRRVAVRANRAALVAFGQQLAVDALEVAGAFIMASLVRVFKSITVIPSVLWRYKKIKVMLLNTCTAMRHGIKLHCKIKRLFL